jgi:mono/diheme cytochrome c family protein
VRDRANDSRIAAISAGQKVAFGYNCTGCHIMEGYGGDIWPLLEDGMQPPNLQSEGYRVNHDWLFRFLHDPTMGSGRQHYIRPWLKVRMPTFGFKDEEVNTLIRYFTALDNRPIFQEFRTPYRPNPAMVAVGKKLYDALQCMACHPMGPVQPGADVAQLAPNLQLARERLQPEWIVDWLLDPQKFQPGTSMPTFFPYNEQTGKHDSPMPDILGGDARKQAEALRDYLLTLSPPAMAKRP